MELKKFRNLPSKIVKPTTKCPICMKDCINARALVQHNQIMHLFDYRSTV